MKTAVQRSSCFYAPQQQLNPNLFGLTPSATIAINELSDRLTRQGRKIFKLGLGQSPFPVPTPVVKELQRNAHQKDYLPVAGLPALRKAVADHYRRTFGIDCEPEEVLIGPGSKELMFLLQLAYYGDLVVPTPAWVSYAPQARIIGRQVHLLPTHLENGWRLVPEQLEQLCSLDPVRPRIVVLNYPSNPTGMTYGPDELEALAEVARKYRLIILSDEIYGKLHHENGHVSIVNFYPEGTILSGGLSKWCGAGGWRLGVLVFPHCLSWLLQAMAAVASETYTSTCAPIQYAAIKAFEPNPEIRRYLSRVQRILKALGQHLTATLTEAGINVLPPDGGFYLFPDFSPLAERLRARGISSSVELAERLLADTGVAILPGVHFGQPPAQLTARIAYVNFDGNLALQALEQLPETALPDVGFLESWCADTLQAINLLTDWLQA